MMNRDPEGAPPRPRHPHGLLVAAVTLLVFFVVDPNDWILFRALADDTTGWTRRAAHFALVIVPQVLILMVVAAALFGRSQVWEALGLNRSPLTGLVFGLGVTAVMALGLAASAPFAPPDNAAQVIVRGALFPGFREELWYRAFLFGFLFRYGGWGFLPAALLGAVIFGAGHLYQSNDPAELVAIFAITGLGGLWFAWLYTEWDFNIWVPASVHVLMNAWWIIFPVSDTAQGPMSANLSRFAVILLSIIVTVIHARTRGGRTVRGRSWLIGGPAERP